MNELKIIGAGIGGLVAAWYAQKAGVPCQIYEASSIVGGNAVTISHDDGFYYDSGAHRFHDKDPEMTTDLLDFMAESLHRVDAPSQIFYQGHFVDFPLSPLNLMTSLGFLTCMRGAFSLFRERMLNNSRPLQSFADFSIRAYGQVVADRFLLNYSEKLWGLPCDQLSPVISGKRLEGLNLKTFFVETLLGKKAKTKHLDGSFWYPNGGIGRIADRLADSLDPQSIQLDSSLTSVRHDGHRITEITVNGHHHPVEHLLCTFPLTRLLTMLDPQPPTDILSLAQKLQTRNVILVALFLDKSEISTNASIYFPESHYPFTRIYEPKNRCQTMAPFGETSLVAEIPCGYEEGSLWYSDDVDLTTTVLEALSNLGLFSSNDVKGTSIYRMADAYPVLDKEYEHVLSKLNHYFQSFENLYFSGRNGTFSYIHIHDLMSIGKRLAAQLAGSMSR